MNNLSAIIPTLNSENFILNSITQLGCFLDNSQQVDEYELILVVQRSDDNTLAVLNELARKNKRIKVFYLKTRGKGNAVSTGIQNSKYPILFLIDDDIPYDLRFIDQSLNQVNQFEIIIASRYCQKMPNDAPLSRKIASVCYRILVRILFRIPQKDIQAGSKMMRKDIFDKIPIPKETRYVWDTELLYYANKQKLKIKELPFGLTQKPNFLKIHKTLFEMLLDVIRLRLRTL